MPSVQVQVLVDGKPVAGIITDSEQRKFTTGSVGYRAQGTIAIGNEAYTIGCNLIKIGSKPKVKK